MSGDGHMHTFVAYPAPSGYMLDTGEWLWACVHPGCMAIREDEPAGERDQP